LVGVAVKATDVPAQIDPEGTAAILTLTGSVGSTVIILEAVAPSHNNPPWAVSVKVTVGKDVADAVYAAKAGIKPPLLVNDPPAPPSDQIALVAFNPYEPPKAADVPP